MPLFLASPLGAFLAELPFKAASAACCRRQPTEEVESCHVLSRRFAPLSPKGESKNFDGNKAFPLPILATAKISKNCQALRAFPLGGRCRAKARRMRGATDSREMILNGNETAPLFENFLQGKCNCPLIENFQWKISIKNGLRPSPPPLGGASPQGEALK